MTLTICRPQEVRKTKIKVKERFVDRTTKEMREAGRVYEYPKKRADELIKGGYAEPAENEKTEQK